MRKVRLGKPLRTANVPPPQRGVWAFASPWRYGSIDWLLELFAGSTAIISGVVEVNR